MGLLSRAGDVIYAFKFLRTLTKPWNKMEAFKLGIIDKDGTVLKKGKDLQTPEEKSAYTIFHRLVFNVKRLIGKVPGGKSTLGSYAAALYLIKEHTELSEEEIKNVMSELLDTEELESLEEATWFQENNKLKPGEYQLVQEVAHPVTGEIIGFPKDKVKVNEFLEPTDRVFNQNIYKVNHRKTGLDVYITNEDIRR